ncbi:MAG: acyl-CoA dehydrogenase [Planctomycetes bacterium]|nr:acyl-CoA dehydrogenase [Planctomycetota bacterium]
MILALVIVLALLVFLALTALGRGWLGWVVAGAIVLAWWKWKLAAAPTPFWTVAAVFGVLALVFGFAPLRRVLFGGLSLKLVGKALPTMSDTERAALEAGTVWWDAELFSGAPRWQRLLDFHVAKMTSEERLFVDEVVGELSKLCVEHEVEARGDLSERAWQLIKSKGLMGMIIPKEYGGLGFTAAANSAVIVKLSSRSVTAAVSVMVPNSLGPAELLLHYGTDEQKKFWLPRLANGSEVPCFALTEPGAGSDAASITSTGTICRGTFEGREVLGMRLDWSKRYITLAPVATVLGLAFKLRDPEHLLGQETELGITCALIPVTTPGVQIGKRHDPLGVPFMNGPTEGHGVFVPLDFIIGGPKLAGHGWRMLMQCLSAGRGVSLPALSVGAAQLAARAVGAHATIREQFGLPIGRFEGVEEKLAKVGGLTYLIDSGRKLTLGAIDAGEKPSVITAIMKCYATETMRVVINDAMDVLGGNGICLGPRNVLGSAYKAIPIGITVEGANILTRTMIVFGQGAIRCHPFVQREMRAVAERDVAAFDAAFFGHVNLVFTNAARGLLFSLGGTKLVGSPTSGAASEYYPRLERLATAFSLCADFAMATLGGQLKRKENLCGRLADALAHLYLGSAVLKRYFDGGAPDREAALMRWAAEHALERAEHALDDFLRNLPNRPAAWLVRALVLPFGRREHGPSDRRHAEVARGLLEDRPERVSLSSDIFLPPASDPGLGRLEAAQAAVLAAQPARNKLKEAAKQKKLAARGSTELLDAAVAAGILSEEERKLVEAAEIARRDAILVDAFTPDEFAARAG